jgi:ATP-dependent DNA helicase RecQ
VQHFKDWRRRTAQTAAVPAYVVMSDATLEDLCRRRPANLDELLQVNGIGERKAESYGSEILATFREFREGAVSLFPSRDNSTESPAEETLRLLAENKSLPEIAEIRGCRLQTVVKRVSDLIEEGTIEYRVNWVGEDIHNQTEEAALRLGTEFLKPIKEALPPEITYGQIRLVVAYLRRTEAAALK